MFELAEFSSLASKYTQTLYRLLKQFRTTGYLTMLWADFIEIMDIHSGFFGLAFKTLVKHTQQINKMFYKVYKLWLNLT